MEPAEVSASGRRFPLVSLVAVNAHGMTFRSRCEFTIGSRLELGIHVRLRNEETSNRYVPLSGYVVVSHLASHRGQPVYEVTLLFDEIDPGDAELLSKLPEAEHAPDPRVPGKPEPSSSQPRSAIGLN